jgi:DNA helicase HerA-like ATPase
VRRMADRTAPQDAASEPVGMVLGTEDATPLTFWVGIAPDAYLQLDDAVLVDTEVPGRGRMRVSGIVQDVRARHEGASFDTDVFLIEQGVLPVDTAVAAQVVATRFEPEIYVPPMPGLPSYRARGADRDQAMYFDQMVRRVPCGLSRDGEPVYLDLDFLDGTRGAHVNISGISGVATKTTYALFLLYALFHSPVLGGYRANTKAIVFNVKGEDLMWLDRPNAHLTEDDRLEYARLGLPAGPFDSVGLWAPPRPGAASSAAAPVPHVESRADGVTAYYWTVRDFVRERFLRFLFAEAENERSQIADLVARVEAALDRECEDDPDHQATVVFGGYPVRDFDALCDLIRANVEDEGSSWRGRLSDATVAAFVRRLDAARFHLSRHRLIWGRDAEDARRHRIDWEANQVTVVDIHNLHDKAKRFVTGVVIKRLFEHKEQMGRREPLAFLVLDELNRYAPRDGDTPIKEVLLDVAERGRSLGMILIGAEQTASEVERRVIANSAFRVVGRLDTAEAQRSEYGFLPAVTRARASILKPGSMILQQPTIPVPLQIRFPFPCWATRADEAEVPAPGREPVFDRFTGD